MQKINKQNNNLLPLNIVDGECHLPQSMLTMGQNPTKSVSTHRSGIHLNLHNKE